MDLLLHRAHDKEWKDFQEGIWVGIEELFIKVKNKALIRGHLFILRIKSFLQLGDSPDLACVCRQH